MNTPSDSEHDGKSHGGSLLAALAFGLILYIALLGPAVRLYNVCPKPVQKGIEYIYIPLIWLDQFIPSQPFEKYARMWDPTIGPGYP
jgi:hypothetical protein